MSERVYLDHAATTPVDRAVIAAMLPILREGWGNPSGIYREAQRARQALDEARDVVAGRLAARRGRSCSRRAGPRPTTRPSGAWRRRRRGGT